MLRSDSHFSELYDSSQKNKNMRECLEDPSKTQSKDCFKDNFNGICEMWFILCSAWQHKPKGVLLA